VSDDTDGNSGTGTIQLSGVLAEVRALAGNRVPAIILYDGDEIGALFSLTLDETVIGRTAACEMVIPESGVSRRHALIRRIRPGSFAFEVEDLGSTNGTLVNGSQVARAVLSDGDKITIGGRILKFAVLDKADLAYQSRIAQMIHVDELTGLLTKRSLYRAFETEIIRALRYKHPITVLMMDLDHFKLVNDTHGHLVGSHCLAEVGKLIRAATRATDMNGRYGGEEFISFLPETDTAPAFIAAERIRTSLAVKTFRHKDTEYHVRISIGLATLPRHGTDVETLVHAADMALYRAKHLGRDRCIVYEPDAAGVAGT